MDGKHFLFLTGTRPERIKVWPIIRRLRALDRVVLDIHTGQHTSLMAGLPAPDINLGFIATGDLDDDITAMILRINAFLLDFGVDRIHRVVVHGDTMSTIAGCTAAYLQGIPVCHVEAGVRSGHYAEYPLPFPEEGYRRRVTQMASWHFCPTPRQARHCRTEGVQKDRVFVTGNTIVDALADSGIEYMHTKDPTVLITLHRRESFGSRLDGLLRGVCGAARSHPRLTFIFPAHPNPEVQRAIERLDVVPPNLHIVDPLVREEFLPLLQSAQAVITDSGGVQEEAAILGVPSVIARRHTDRPETVESGHSLLLGDADGEVIEDLLTMALNLHPGSFTGYGTPEDSPSDRIVTLLTTPL